MATDLILITGATGFVGFRVLLYALQQGYNVRAVVRSQAKADTITSNTAFQKLNKSSNLSFVTIPDFLTTNAFAQALEGVTCVLHIASPNGLEPPPEGKSLEKYFVHAAVQNTLTVLESAKNVPSVKRIVITSSVGAILGPHEGAYTAEIRQQDPRCVLILTAPA
jgi:nucleoside-diphosphate-sugar epimerase